MILTAISKIYEYIVQSRNKKFEDGRYPVSKLDCKVISVGNIIAGGSGKTPFTIFLGKLLIEKGLNIGIVGSGYGRKNKGLKVVCDGDKVLVGVEDSGDEMQLIAHKLKGPVVVAERKVEAAEYLNKNFNIDVIIVDDGFQHRYLYRDLDIVLINQNTIDTAYTFPKGMLREPLENYKRANLLCLEKGIRNKKKFTEIENVTYNKQFKCLKEYSEKEEKVIYVNNNKTLLTCSIADPKSFQKSIEELGIKLIETIFYKDHYNYKQEDVEKFVYICKKKNAKSIITTEKDFVKLISFKDILFKNNISLIVSEVETVVDNNAKLIEVINNKCNFNI